MINFLIGKKSTNKDYWLRLMVNFNVYFFHEGEPYLDSQEQNMDFVSQ